MGRSLLHAYIEPRAHLSSTLSFAIRLCLAHSQNVTTSDVPTLLHITWSNPPLPYKLSTLLSRHKRQRRRIDYLEYTQSRRYRWPTLKTRLAEDAGTATCQSMSTFTSGKSLRSCYEIRSAASTSLTSRARNRTSHYLQISRALPKTIRHRSKHGCSQPHG